MFFQDLFFVMLNWIFSANPAFNISTCTMFLFCFLFKSGIPRNLVASSCFFLRCFSRVSFNVFFHPAQYWKQLFQRRNESSGLTFECLEGSFRFDFFLQLNFPESTTRLLVLAANFWVVLRICVSKIVFHWRKLTTGLPPGEREILHPRSRSFPNSRRGGGVFRDFSGFPRGKAVQNLRGLVVFNDFEIYVGSDYRQ